MRRALRRRGRRAARRKRAAKKVRGRLPRKTEAQISASAGQKVQVVLTVNGQKREATVRPKTTLLDLLREELNLKGTNKGCGIGDCGACTVIMDSRAVNSCLVLAIDAAGSDIRTVEGLSSPDKLHLLQQAFIEVGAIQCGFCTPGMLMAAKALLDRNPDPTEEEIKVALSGNICRCTGYKKIIEAVSKVAEVMKDG